MTKLDRTPPKEDVELLLKVFWHHLKIRWYLVVATTLMAACWVLFVFFQSADYFESRCAFVMGVNTARTEDDRLQSRDLVAKAINRMDRVQVAHYVEKGIRGKFDMYTESPFWVKINSFPAHLTRQPFPILFRGAKDYEMEIGGTTYVGKLGEPFSEGAIELTVVKTAHWRLETRPEATFQFEVFSPVQLLGQFRSGLQVIHRLDDAERIEIRYQDRNENRALDFMGALSTAYREDWRARTQAPYQLHLDHIEEELAESRRQLVHYPAALQAELGRNPFLGDSSAFRQEAWLKGRPEQVLEGIALRQQNPEFRILLESHYQLLADRYAQREKLALQPPNMQMSESPYVIRIQSKGRTLMQMASLTLLGTFAGLGLILLISFQDPKIRIPAQMAAGGKWELLGRWTNGSNAEVLRNTQLGATRLFRQGKKTFLFTHRQADKAQQELVENLARALHARGYKVLLVEPEGQTTKAGAWETWSLPAGTALESLLGGQSFAQTLNEKKEGFDFVLLNLPDFQEKPTSELVLFDCDAVVYTLKKGVVAEKEWKKRTEHIEQLSQASLLAVFQG